MKKIQIEKVITGIRQVRWFFCCVCVLVFLAFTCGCGNKFFDPAQVGRFRPVPAVNVILDTLGVAEETPAALEQAEDPQPTDTVVMESDYVFRAGDIVRISIFELLQEGVQFVNDYVVTETGKISIPEVGVVEAAGLTETQLEEEIRQILSPSILKEPSVVASLLASQQRTFSILGDGVLQPGRYVIPRYGFRLADALATAGGSRQFNVSYIYISRYEQGKEAAGGPKKLGPKEKELIEPGLTEPELLGPEKLLEPEQEPLEEVVVPRAQHQRSRNKVVVTTSEMVTERELAQASGPGALEMLDDKPGDWRENLKNRVSNNSAANGSAEPQTTDEAIENEPVSVRDILKTLSEKSRQGQTASTRPTTTKTTPRTEPSDEILVEVPSETQEDVEVTTPVPVPSSREKTSGQVGTRPIVRPSTGVRPPTGVGATSRERVGERVKVNDILKTLSERRTAEKTPVKDEEEVEPSVPPPPPTAEESGDGETDINAILKSLSKRAGPAEEVKEPAEAEKTEEKPDVDAMLRSLSQRRSPVTEKIREAAPAEEMIAPEKLDERINVDEILKTLPKRPGREAVEEPIEIDQIIKPSTETVVPELPEQEIPVEEIIAPLPTVKPTAPKAVDENGRIEWVFQDGKWVPIQVGVPKAVEPVIKFEPGEELIMPLEEKPVAGPELEWAETPKTRLIRVPTDRLLAGDSRYNVVIKPGDTIHVPVDIIGEFCVMGNVINQGYIPITGRPMTLKMAVAAAGGLGALAWPKKCEVVRRIGKKKEEIVMVDLDEIASGEKPDFFIKPNDLINVGTHATSRWRAILRNAFRATYGFGFVYDRNFADRDYGNSPLPDWF
jgi:polysaccharide export outer membrane protein